MKIKLLAMHNKKKNVYLEKIWFGGKMLENHIIAFLLFFKCPRPKLKYPES